MDRNKRLKAVGKIFMQGVADLEQPNGYFDWQAITDLANTLAEDLTGESIPAKTTRDYLMYLVTEGLDVDMRSENEVETPEKEVA